MLDILVPILYHLNDARSDQCKSPSSGFDLKYSRKGYIAFTCRKLLISSKYIILLFPSFSSSSRFDAYRSVHITAFKWRKKFW